ncbi:hypothetical protein Tco_0896460 [Tanacetum coccineum]
MANKGKKSSTETFVPNDKADYYSEITNITVNGKNTYELKGKFLDDLHNNAFSGTNRKGAVEHIEYYLKIIDPIKLPNDDHDKLRIVIFPILLAGGARRWKYYPPSRIEGNNTPVIKWDPANPRFEGWLATKFVNYKTMDIFTKGALWDYWKMGGDEIEVFDNESSDLEECWSDKEETAKNFKIETNDYEWYEALEDSELKDLALRNKAIMDGVINEDDDESRYEQKKRCNIYTNYDDVYEINHRDNEREELCEIHELPACNIRRYMMIKYSFNNDEEYVAVKKTNMTILLLQEKRHAKLTKKSFR